MPSKSRTPDPPRRVQAPRPRTGGGQGDGDRRRWLIPGLVAVVGAAAVAALLAVFAFGGEEKSARQVLRDPGCDVQTVRAQSRDHVEQPRPGFEYNTDPPTSGPHHPIPAPFDIYTEPVEQFRLLHNLEHGGVVIQYGLEVTADEIGKLTDWYREDPNGLVIAPYPQLGNQIALGSWVTEGKQEDVGQGVLAKCPRFDEGAFDAFLDEYGFKGPESDHGDGQGFAREDLQPGA